MPRAISTITTYMEGTNRELRTECRHVTANIFHQIFPSNCRFLSGGKRNAYWDQTGKCFDVNFDHLSNYDFIILFDFTTTRGFLKRPYGLTTVL